MRFYTLLTAFALGMLISSAAPAVDLIPGFLKNEEPEVGEVIWELQEQYVRLEAQDDIRGGKPPPNDHPVELDPVALSHALASVKIWESGGFFRDEQTTTLFASTQAEVLGRYISEALAKAGPAQDVTFNSRSYAKVMLDVAKERQWTTGRVFFRDGKLNLIIGEFRKQISKDKRGAEASFGILEEDWRDVYFAPASRTKKGEFKGRVVETAGVSLSEDAKGRGDWLAVEVATAAQAFVDAETPAELREQQRRAEEEAARLTLERRQMREEMARMRQQIKELSEEGGGSAGADSLEQRLTTLETLKNKGLITDDEYRQRRQEILQDI